MIRFYSNENLSLDLVTALRRLGYDVLTSYEARQANQGIPDKAVLHYATTIARCIVTFDRGDFLALHRASHDHFGIVVCREERDYLAQVQVLHDYLQNEGQDLRNRLLRLQKQNQPESSQQGFIIREYYR